MKDIILLNKSTRLLYMKTYKENELCNAIFGYPDMSNVHGMHQYHTLHFPLG